MIYSFSNSGFRDPETGVYNQTYFMEVFHREWHRHIREHQGLALLYLRPHIHETISQPQLLELFMKQVQLALLRTTDLLARLDNRSFALGLFDVNYHGAEVVAKRLENTISRFNQNLVSQKHNKIDYQLSGCVCVPNKELYLDKLFETVEKHNLALHNSQTASEQIIHM